MFYVLFLRVSILYKFTVCLIRQYQEYRFVLTSYRFKFHIYSYYRQLIEIITEKFRNFHPQTERHHNGTYAIHYSYGYAL